VHVGPGAGVASGYGLFLRAARCRLLLGLEPVKEAPLAPPPPAVAGV
jgi:hypothetical protein